ncbi:MAG: hypothetical protein ABFC77_07390 [Thermoguttaceae bacterium]
MAEKRNSKKTKNDVSANFPQEPAAATQADRPWLRAAWVAVGIVVCQAILFGPSLVGWKILLPLDYLASPGVYLPRSPETENLPLHNYVRSDLILMGEPNRQFAAGEFRAGRLPLWMPYQFAGCPFAGFSKYSPFEWIGYCVRSPIALAWAQLLLALFIGAGTYWFCRHALHVGPWPATVAAWCWPMAGFFVFWQGYGPVFAAAWLPWLLLAVDRTVRRTGPWAAPSLAVATGLLLVSGQLDVAAQVLLASGLYAVWCFIDQYGKQCFSRAVLPAIAAVTIAWLLGMLLASPYWIPLVEYSRTGSRMARRSQGEEERPPVGLEALPEIVLPDVYGSTQIGNFPIFPKGQGNQLESASVTYTGLLITLLAAPLAWCSRRHRSMNVFWAILAVLGVSWCLDVPGVVDLLRLPGLKMMSHNRFTFATSMALLAMAAVGLDVLWRNEVRPRGWFLIGAGVLAAMLLWCLWRTVVPPEPIATQLGQAVASGQQVFRVPDAASVRRIQENFSVHYAMAAALCLVGAAAWLLIWRQKTAARWLLPVLSGLMVVDLVWFAFGRSSQCDPALYYPRIPALEETAAAGPGRILGVGCLPAALAQTHGLRDIRGYDAVDPARLMDLMHLAVAPNTASPMYAMTQWFIPQIYVSPKGDLRLSPVLDLLNVRWLVFRGQPRSPLRPQFASPDYWVVANPNVLPRAFVPERVETVADDAERLVRLGNPGFNPRQVAYVEQPLELPERCRGEARIVDEIPSRVTISLDMQTPGLVVLGDLWDTGWNAYLDGKSVAVLRTNHALRGVVAPKGRGTLEFRYEPIGFAWGLRLSGLAVVALVGWSGVLWRHRRKTS